MPRVLPVRGSAAARLGRWDRVGVWASFACALHCLAAPVVLLALPSLAGIWAHPLSHALFAALVLPLAAAVLSRGYRLHRRTWVPAIAAVGIGCILLGTALPLVGGEVDVAGACGDCCPQVLANEQGDAELDWPLASVATLLGSGLLVAGHVGNLSCCRGCRPGQR